MVKALADAVARVNREFYYASDLYEITGIPESTWHYYAFAKKGPPSHKIGRRRVWPVEKFRIWLREQQEVT
jgi:prophage regulatory protein